MYEFAQAYCILKFYLTDKANRKAQDQKLYSGELSISVRPSKFLPIQMECYNHKAKYLIENYDENLAEADKKEDQADKEKKEVFIIFWSTNPEKQGLFLY